MLNTIEVTKILLTLSEKLTAKSLTLGSAESCTGGGIGYLFTSLSGSSNWYKGGVIAYSNNLKINLLNVLPEEIECHGAVSEHVARSMAIGVAHAVNTDIAVSTTGIAGPSGGSIEKPVGTVCFGWVVPDGNVTSETVCFDGDRESIREQSIVYTVKKLIKLL